MIKKHINYTPILIIITIITSALAIYFAIKLQQVKFKYSEVKENLNVSNTSESVLPLATIDSLMLKENYILAMQIIDSSSFSKEIKTQQELNFRRTIAANFISVKNQFETLQKTKVKKSSSVNIEGNFRKVNKENQNNILELEAANNEIIALKRQLDNYAENGYLTFETLKGIKLHYVGNLINEKANGFGIAILESGSRYEGEWKNNMRHGKGKFLWDDGDYYEGNYTNGKRDGKGVYYWKNGEKYVGYWKNDQRNGKGEFYNKKSEIKISGIWENDKLVKED